MSRDRVDHFKCRDVVLKRDTESFIDIDDGKKACFYFSVNNVHDDGRTLSEGFALSLNYREFAHWWQWKSTEAACIANSAHYCIHIFCQLFHEYGSFFTCNVQLYNFLYAWALLAPLAGVQCDILFNIYLSHSFVMMVGYLSKWVVGRRYPLNCPHKELIMWEALTYHELQPAFCRREARTESTHRIN